ncbi:MAG: SDR family NAD(P)-dependent oxidoreductase, partial [Firmicutes bacterium]|nr:SDR family NAD(P)-dependent oxidoreductase [Bacillota bacterium]
MNKNVYVITGGAGGIGLATAKEFTDGIVMISDVNPAALEKGKEVLEAVGIEAVTKVCDITNREQVKEMAKEAAALGNVKGVVHSAGVSGDIGRLDLVLKIDLLGTYYIIEEFLDVMGKDSSMVLIASMMADTVPPNADQDALLLDPDQEDIIEKLIPF